MKVGRLEIVDYFTETLGLTSWQTVRMWRKKYKFPLHHLPSGRPYFIESEVKKWMEENKNIPL